MHCYGTTKRRRNVSVTKLRLTLVAFLAMQFPDLICNLTSQFFSLSKQEKQLHTFHDINFSNISWVDLTARSLMQKLHDELDYDDDGNVSRDEGAEFIDREDFDSSSENLPGFATDKDGRITEAEFWDSWINSTVHNWTVAQMIEWLSYDVDLPQYVPKFKRYGISGASMPILAGNNSLVLSLVNGVKEHRLKLWLKAMEVVLCGYTQPKTHFLKDVLLSISIILAFGGLAYALHVRRNAAAAVAIMQEKLGNLQKEMKILEEEDQLLRDESRDDAFNQSDTHSSQSSLESDSSSLYSRLTEVLDELSDTKTLLEQAEVKLNDRKWKAPDRLLICLKETHKAEMKLHETKRQLAHRKVEQAKAQFLKMKKKASFFNYVQLLHSQQVDTFDVEIELAKNFLREVQRDSHEYKKRWKEIASICQLTLSSNFVSSATIPYQTSLPNFPRKSSDVMSCSSGYSISVKDFDEENDSGLLMKEFSSDSNGFKPAIPAQHSQASRAQRRSDPFPIRSSSTFLGIGSSNHKSPSPIPEEDDCSQKSRTLPKRRSISPSKFTKNLFSRNLEKLKSEDGTTSTRSDVTLTSHEKSKSSNSLPDLTQNSVDNFNSADENGQNNKCGTSSKRLKKRSIGSSFIKKIIKY